MTDSPISDIHYAIGMISSIEMMDNKLINFLITTDDLKGSLNTIKFETKLMQQKTVASLYHQT